MPASLANGCSLADQPNRIPSRKALTLGFTVPGTRLLWAGDVTVPAVGVQRLFAASRAFVFNSDALVKGLKRFLASSFLISGAKYSLKK